MILDSLSLILANEFNVHTAPNGSAALDKVGTLSESISLILLDLDMPVMSGVEFLQRIRSEYHEIPVIILTGRGNHEWARQCADLGVHGYVDKLIDTKELIGKIRKILGL